MRPAGENLEALDLAVRQLHDRLEVNEDLAPLDRRFEVETELPLGAKLLVELRLVQRVRALRPLDAVHRDVRVADQVLTVRRARIADGDADADVTGHVAAVEDVRPVDRLQHAARHGDGRLRVGVANEYRELVAAEPGGEILGADRAGEPVRELREQLVAGAVTPGVVDGLEPVEVEIEDGRRGAARELVLDRLEQVKAVRQAGEAVVVRLVAELLLELRHLGERMLEPAVLEQDARMAGEGAEQLDVGLGERADVPEALADDEQAERPVLAAQRSHDRVLEPARGEERIEGVCRTAPREQHRRAGGGDLRERRGILRRELVLRMHEQLAFGSADAAQGAFALGSRKQEDLGVLGAKQPARGDQELPHREAELRRALRRAHRLVEELEVLPLLALLHVAAEGRDGRENRHDEQEDGGWADLEERHDREAERRGRKGAERRGHERPAELRCLEALLGDCDDGRDEQDPDDMGDRARDEHETHRCGAESVGEASERKTISAMPLQSGSSARLNANLASWRSWLRRLLTTRATNVPTSCPISSDEGAASKRPRVSPTSVSDSVWACLRNWRWTTRTSAR